AAAWRERPRPSSTAGFWRKWRTPGRSSPRRPRYKRPSPIGLLLGVVLLCQAQPYLRHLSKDARAFGSWTAFAISRHSLTERRYPSERPMRQMPLRQSIATRESALRSGCQLRAVQHSNKRRNRTPPRAATVSAGLPAKGHPETKTPPERPRAGCIGARAAGSARLSEGAFRHSGRTRRGAQQPHGRDHLATVENAHQLGDRQFGVTVGGVEISCELRLRGAHRIENCRQFVFHTHANLVFPGKE